MIRRAWRACLRAMRTVVGRRRFERDLTDELAFHLEREAEQLQARGMTVEQAALAAHRAFGSVARAAEEAREVKRSVRLEAIARDLRIAWRGLRRTPGVTLAAVATLGIGIGAPTVMYSITRGVLRDLPVPEPERLVHIVGVDRRTGRADERLGAWELQALADQRALTAVAAYEDESFHLSDSTRLAERRSGAVVTPSVFSVLGVAPAFGRGFADADVAGGAEPTVILSDRVWRDRFGADPGAVGQTIRVNGTARTIIGVMPPGFAFPRYEDVWVPFAPAAGGLPGAGPRWTAIGRLAPGRSLAEARAELRVIGDRFAGQSPATHRDVTLSARPYRDEQVRPEARVLLYAMVLVVSFVLLIAGANVANLLVARAAGRARELAVRGALGASRARLSGQILAEVVVLAAAGGALGVVLAGAGVAVFNAGAAFELAYFMRVAVDARVLAFATILVGGATLVAGFVPARRAIAADPADSLRAQARGSSAPGSHRASGALVAVQVGLSCALLAVTAAMILGIRTMRGALPGVVPDSVAVAQLELRPDAYPTLADRGRFYRAAAGAIEALPGAQRAAFTTVTPGTGRLDHRPNDRLDIDGRAVPRDERPMTAAIAVTPGHFEMLHAAPLAGRAFDWGDDAEAPRVAVVDQRFVERHFAGQPPLGHRIRLGADTAWVTVVGIVPVLDPRPGERDGGAVYLPLSQRAVPVLTLLVQTTSGVPADLAARIPRIVAALDPDVPVFGVATLAQQLRVANSSEWVFGKLFLAFGVAALVMASIGLTGLVANGVRRRSRELGIRLALGADPRSVRRLVVRGGIWPLGLGLAAGLVLARLLAPTLTEALMGSDPRDWRIYAVTAGALAGVGVLASWLPARRVTRLVPSRVLSEE